MVEKWVRPIKTASLRSVEGVGVFALWTFREDPCDDPITFITSDD